MISIFSFKMSRIPHLSTLLGQTVKLRLPYSTKGIKIIAGWGLKASSLRARNIAKKLSVPYIAIEDGFIRSMGLGNDDPPLSIAVDDLGIYYDASRESRLEKLIQEPLSGTEILRANSVVQSWQASFVSKYNFQRNIDLKELPHQFVLVVDQTKGDASIQYGLADENSFQIMLDSALRQYPNHDIVVKVHPEVMSGNKEGHFNVKELSSNPRVIILAKDVHPATLLSKASAVFCVTSQIGFEALIWGKSVHTFGLPFYAGWGLTNDFLPAPSRRHKVCLEQLVYATLIKYCRYIDPVSNQSCEVETVISWLALQRSNRQRYPSKIYAYGFSLWKRSLVRDFLHGSELIFIRNLHKVPKNACLVIWGQKDVTNIDESIQVLRMEDGFIRSVGLGADLVRPVSWVIDDLGIYYDAHQPSRLEVIIQEYQFDASLLNRAQKLIELIQTNDITKYNLKQEVLRKPETTKPLLLVVGQVETDASILKGSPHIRSNIELLMRVRSENPDAYIIYKPHPDVVAGLRTQDNDQDKMCLYSDEIILNSSLTEILKQVDEVHVLTSLAGFEALIRNKKVVCYGYPFYAGWGLTTDVFPIERRSRRVTVLMLVSATLILYPTYVSRSSRRFASPEAIISDILDWKENSNPNPLWRRLLRPFLKKR